MGTGGQIYKVDATTGAQVWATFVSDVTGLQMDFSRSSPTIAGDLVLVGNQAGRFGAGPATLVALDKADGSLVWSTQLDSGPATSSPTVHDGVAYVGVASNEELFAIMFGIQPYGEICCKFRGSVVAVDVATGAILWQTYMAPEGYSGNAVWGSSPAVDAERNQVYVATGNNYSAPQSYLDCLTSAKNDRQRQGCSPGNNYFDSVVALKLDTGEVNWATRTIPTDTWNVACDPFIVAGFPIPTDGIGVNCEFGGEKGPDFDFGQGPILINAAGPGRAMDIVGVGQKSGVYWALRPANGDVLWSTRTGPGGIAGGHQWGSSSDGERIYTSNAYSFGGLDAIFGIPPYTLVNPVPGSAATTYAGIYSALDVRTGEILWQLASPANEAGGSPTAVANGVVYVCSFGGPFAGITGGSNLGNMLALDAATGTVLKNFVSGASCAGGAAISDGHVYWGNGYTAFGGLPGTNFYKLGLQ